MYFCQSLLGSVMVQPRVSAPVSEVLTLQLRQTTSILTFYNNFRALFPNMSSK